MFRIVSGQSKNGFHLSSVSTKPGLDPAAFNNNVGTYIVSNFDSHKRKSTL